MLHIPQRLSCSTYTISVPILFGKRLALERARSRCNFNFRVSAFWFLVSVSALAGTLSHACVSVL